MKPSDINQPSALSGRPKRGVPEGLWIRCSSCKASLFRKDVEERFHVCPECDHHFYMPTPERID
ncbi:MAG: acetyl-CoA carboxylase carboxyl transferase subunit beta, partial [Planctomycetia bacterium]